MTTIASGPPGALADAVAAASARHLRDDPVLPRTGGPAGNAVLTAWTGLVLLVLFIAELLTLFDVRGLITWHVALGALLVPPALLKTGVTTWRLVRYYRGNDAYHQAGPPPLLLRLLGPLVVLSTLGLLSSGILLVLLGEQTGQHVLVSPAGFRVSWVTLHQADFAVWAGATGLHLIGRLAPAIVTTVRGARSRIPGRASRYASIAGVAVLTVPLALALTHLATSWHH